MSHEAKTDEHFMRMAIAQARLAKEIPGAGEVGCVIVRDGIVLARGYNEADLTCDPTAHAEIVTLRKVGQMLRATDFRGCTLYCSLQPCGMCTVACIWAKITRIVYGAARRDVHSMYFDSKHINAIDLVHDAFRNDIELVGGILAKECAALYYRPGEHPPKSEQTNL